MEVDIGSSLCLKVKRQTFSTTVLHGGSAVFAGSDITVHKGFSVGILSHAFQTTKDTEISLQ